MDVTLTESDLLLTELRRKCITTSVKKATELVVCALVCLEWTLTLSWLNLSRSLSQLNEDSRRRCSERLSEPARVEAWG